MEAQPAAPKNGRGVAKRDAQPPGARIGRGRPLRAQPPATQQQKLEEEGPWAVLFQQAVLKARTHAPHVLHNVRHMCRAAPGGVWGAQEGPGPRRALGVCWGGGGGFGVF